jgi:putative sigma-54 modulation protein
MQKGVGYMKIIITGRKTTLAEKFKEKVEKKLTKLDKFFHEDSEAHVTVTLVHNKYTVEVTIFQGGLFFRAEDTAENMYDSLESAVDALTLQIKKNKERLYKRCKDNSFGSIPEFDEEIQNEEYEIVKNKKFFVKPMDVEEAILQMNLLGHEFFIFRDVSTGEINVIYRRKDGNYGLLEPVSE